jgi:hypothetical protein
MAERVGVRHNRQPRHLVVGQIRSPITVVATGRMKMSAARRPLATLFGRIVRFQRAFSALGFECGAAIAARYGFADPAHLVHEIRRFAGQPPTALAEASGLTAFFARSGWRDRYLLQPETRLAPSFALGKARSDLSPEQATRLAPPASRRNAGATRQKAGLRPEGSLASFG